ncbi:sensor histidine kinase [Brevibacillus sp. TJ4]|uniref:sensor histidine kinase n=1 Tax=Brevibacillus sp. TJ4 TaxID=3234853 RepID=UPI003BA3BB0B
MDTKSTNKRGFLRVVMLGFVLTVTILAITVVDLTDKSHYLDKDYYLNQWGYSIHDELFVLAKLIKDVHADPTNRSTTVDKVAPQDLQRLNEEREQKLAKANAEAAAQFDQKISEARAAENHDLVAQLEADKAKLLSEKEQQIQEAWDASVLQLARAADMRYEVKQYSLLLRDGTFKYYIRDKGNDNVYTNLESEPTELEVRQSALITVQIPAASGEDSWGLTRFFQENRWEGLIYIPKKQPPYSPEIDEKRAELLQRYSQPEESSQPEQTEADTAFNDEVDVHREITAATYPTDFQAHATIVEKTPDIHAMLNAAEQGHFHNMISDAIYYQSLRERLLKEIFVLVIGLIAAAALAWYLKEQKAAEHPIVVNSLAVMRRLPLDIRLFLLLPIGLVYLIIIASHTFFSLPIDFGHVVQLFLLSPLTFLLLLYLLEAWQYYKNPSTFQEAWHKSYSVKLYALLNDSFANKGILFKLVTLFVLSGGMVLSVPAGLLALNAGGGEGTLVLLFCLFYSGFYLLFVLPYILRRLSLLNRIIAGVAQMSEGNVDTVIDPGSTKGKLANTAHALNRIKDGVQRSLQDQIKSERLKSELITNVSHDLKTPLTSIINYVDLLKREDTTTEERQNYVSILERKTERLKVLIDDLFEASKMASGAVELNIERVNVSALLNQAIAEFSDKIEESSLTFRVNVENQKIYAKLDGKKTWRVFENLISNALKYAMPGTRVHIELTEDDAAVHFAIKNVSSYEINFDADELFERFKRADTSRNTEGSGLGLAIAKSIVELQGGTMSLAIDGDYFKVNVRFPK